MELVTPGGEHLASYINALRSGWSPDNMRPEAAADELLLIEADPVGYLRMQTDRDGSGPPVLLPDGSTVPRLPGIKRWMWDGQFCGVVGLRWQPGTTALPPHCLGHMGFSVVPWKRRRGYASRGLALLLPEAKALGLEFVELTTSVNNIGSQRVIVANGGRLVERFFLPAVYGSGEDFRYRIYLAPQHETPTSAR